MNDINYIINKLITEKSLSVEEYAYLIKNRNSDVYQTLQNEAISLRKTIYGNKIYIRGLIEISNYCKNDCYYCGIRKSNKSCQRYRLTPEEIISCCDKGYNLGFRTFVLQGGEDSYYSDDLMCELIVTIKNKYKDCAVTLSLGEKTKESYKRLFDAGADRYLLRHETADCDHYNLLHPENLQLERRMECLNKLKEIGYQTGCGMMVGSPFQTAETLAKDLKFIEEFQPDMCGIGPFISHKNTPFSNEKNGSAELTCFLLAIVRTIKPNILLPATTAMNSITANGRQEGILASANVLMPNLSPSDTRNKYTLYNNKLSSGIESAEALSELMKNIASIGYEIVYDRGDIIK